MRGRRNATATAPGPTFPGYANVTELASGAFATVYRAVELGTGRSVALKVLRVADTSPHLVEVFEKELGALALLSNHPNVTTLYGTFATPEGRPVLVLELCRESLAHRARQNGPLPAGEVVQVGIKIAGALETAHRSGLLHRDMKPQNILVSQFDEPVLADFGVATLQAQAQSTEGVFGFTTLHAPPEALEGLPLSPSADIYGLASSMYQLLVGRGPFSSYEGEAPASVILRILRDPAPRAPANDVPVALADLMENALAKDPAKRPQTAGDFAEALREIEALAGWAQTPYVAWGVTQTEPAPGSNGGSAPAAASRATSPNAAAAQLAQLLQAETERALRLPDPATEVTPPTTPASPPVARVEVPLPASEPASLPVPGPAVAPPPPPSPPKAPPPPPKAQPAARVASTTPAPSPPPKKAPTAQPTAQAPGPAAHTAPAKAPKASSRSPKPPLSLQPAPPGTRSVIAPPPQERNVVTPLPATAHVRVVAPAERVTPVAEWLAPLPGTQGAAHDRQWPLSPVRAGVTAMPAGSTMPVNPPRAARRTSASGPGLHVAPGSRRKTAMLLGCSVAGAVVVVGGIGLAAAAHWL